MIATITEYRVLARIDAECRRRRRTSVSLHCGGLAREPGVARAHVQQVLDVLTRRGLLARETGSEACPRSGCRRAHPSRPRGPAEVVAFAVSRPRKAGSGTGTIETRGAASSVRDGTPPEARACLQVRSTPTARVEER